MADTLRGNFCAPFQTISSIPLKAPLLRTKAPSLIKWIFAAQGASKGFGSKQETENKTGASKGFGSKQETENKTTKKSGGGRTKRGGGSPPIPKGSESAKGIAGLVRRLEGDERMSAGNENEMGRVDFVRVDGWDPNSKVGGEISSEDLGNLRVRAFSEGVDGVADASAPFYERVVRRVQLLESRGEIAVVEAKPLPPFERWHFGEEQYLQYLHNQLAVHSALEAALKISSQSASGSEGNGILGPDGGEFGTNLLRKFGPEWGLARSGLIREDIACIESNVDFDGKSSVEPTTQTKAYASYLEKLGQGALSSSSDVTPSGLSSKYPSLRILAHVFSLHVTHLTTGVRVGAKAMDNLPVVRMNKAIKFYRDYPDHAKNPLRLLVSSFNELGEALNEEMAEEIMDELGKALQRTSLLLIDLAVEKK